MARGLTDPVEPEQSQDQDAQAELDAVISNLIMAQNRLHDRLVQLERDMDHLKADATTKTADAKRWKRGI
jgi:hypothetical protein